MAAAGSQTVGSLIIDLRANVAQLQSDMDQVKQVLTKSSREMSSQMKADMNETRQTLALMRDDFGIGIPRELRKAIASVGFLRDAVQALGPAFFALGFINLGMEAVSKVTEFFTKKTEEATKEVEKQAEAEKQYLEVMKLGNETHAERLRLIGLIGATEDQKYASERDHLKDLATQQAALLAGKQEELAYLVAALDLEAHRKAALAQAKSDSPGVEDLAYQVEKDKIDAFTKKQQTAIETAHNAYVAALDAVDALDKQHQENKRQDQQKTTDQALAQILQIKNQELSSMDPIAKIDAEWDKNRATIGAILLAHKDTTLTLHDQLGALQGISTFHAQANELAKVYAQYEKQAEESLVRSNQEIQKMANSQGMNPIKGIIDSLVPTSLPQLDGSLKAFHQQIVDNFASSFKDAAEQSKFLTQAMAALDTPSQLFADKSQEISIIWQKLKNESPNGSIPADVIKALNYQLQLANPEFQKLRDASSEFGKDLSGELDQLIVHGKSFHDVLVTLLQDLADIILKMTVLKPLEDMFSGSGDSIGGGIPGFFASLFGIGGGGGGASSGFDMTGGLPGVSPFADGGMPPVNQISLVGERGPELFVPSTAGTIVPNGQFGGTTVIYNVDARGATPGMEQKMQRALQAASQQSVQAAVGAVNERQRRR